MVGAAASYDCSRGGVTNRRQSNGANGPTAALQLPAVAPYNSVPADAGWLWHKMVFGSSTLELPLAGCW